MNLPLPRRVPEFALAFGQYVSATSESFRACVAEREIHGPIFTSKRDAKLRSMPRLAGGELSHSDVLSARQFAKQLQLEKRRTDRSKVPLSLALFRVDAKHLNHSDDFEALVDILSRTKRETDVIGYLGDGLVGLLLPDTDNAGREGFARNVAARAAAIKYSTTSGAYPDQLFESLVTDMEGQPDTLPYFLDFDTKHDEFQWFLKRCMDVIGAAALLVLTSPVMLLTAFAVKVTSPGPVFHTQTRLGRRAAPFTFYKFRSMTAGADESVHREYVTRLIEGRHNEVNHGDAEKPIYKLQSDARITRVGAFIRRTSIDELPQLFNVLKGDLSLVGPRPPIAYEAERYQSWHLRRVLEGRPGITGLWQVEGRNRVPFDEMVRLDLRYTRTWSLWLDVKILAKTAVVVLRSQGDS